MQIIYKTVEALMVVHNLCIDLDDHPEDILDYDPSDNTAGITDEDSEAELEPIPQYGTAFMQCIQVPGRETNTWLREQGLAKRNHLLNCLCPYENYI